MTIVTRQRQASEFRALAPKIVLFGFLVVEQIYENQEMRAHFEAVLMTSAVMHIQCKAIAAPPRCTGIPYRSSFLSKRQWLNLAQKG